VSSKNKKPRHRLRSLVHQAIQKARSPAETAPDAPEAAGENSVNIMSVAERELNLAHKREQAERRALKWAREQQAARQQTHAKSADAATPKSENNLDE